MKQPFTGALSAISFAIIATLASCNDTADQANQPKPAEETDTIPIIRAGDTAHFRAIQDSIRAIRNARDTDTYERPPIVDKIFDTILGLPEVKKLKRYTEQQKNGQELEVRMLDKPNEQHSYYAVEVKGDDKLLYFNIYPQNMKIMYVDIDTETPITLEDWRKKTKKQ